MDPALVQGLEKDGKRHLSQRFEGAIQQPGFSVNVYILGELGALNFHTL